MVKLNRPIYGAFAVFLLLLAFWGCWFSLRGYLAFFKLSEIVIFSWKVGSWFSLLHGFSIFHI